MVYIRRRTYKVHRGGAWFTKKVATDAEKQAHEALGDDEFLGVVISKKSLESGNPDWKARPYVVTIPAKFNGGKEGHAYGSSAADAVRSAQNRKFEDRQFGDTDKGVGVLISAKRLISPHPDEKAQPYVVNLGGDKDIYAASPSDITRMSFTHRLKRGASSAWQATKKASSSAYQGAKRGASSAYQGAKKASSSAYQGAKRGASSAYQGTKKLGSSAYHGAKATGKTLKNRFGKKPKPTPFKASAAALAAVNAEYAKTPAGRAAAAAPAAAPAAPAAPAAAANDNDNDATPEPPPLEGVQNPTVPPHLRGSTAPSAQNRQAEASAAADATVAAIPPIEPVE